MSISADNHGLKKKNVSTDKRYNLRKMDSKLENPMVNILFEIAFWNKQK